MSGTSAPNRRQFLTLASVVAKFVALGTLGLVAAKKLRSRLVWAAVAPPAQQPVRPPGALPEDAFRAACTRCFLCGEVCPVQCIKFPSRVVSSQPEDSAAPGLAKRSKRKPPVWTGEDTPYILPWEQGCTLCMECTKVCPTGALQPLSTNLKASADKIEMGLAVIDRKICLPWNRRSWCGACFTVCPYREKAITVDHQNRPTVHAEHCVGCGLCVELCPIKYKAIAIKAPFFPDRGEERQE